MDKKDNNLFFEEIPRGKENFSQHEKILIFLNEIFLSASPSDNHAEVENLPQGKHNLGKIALSSRVVGDIFRCDFSGGVASASVSATRKECCLHFCVRWRCARSCCSEVN